ncbi:hypothetical protein BSNK01_25730 [Bacillaceae bacterium]
MKRTRRKKRIRRIFFYAFIGLLLTLGGLTVYGIDKYYDMLDQWYAGESNGQGALSDEEDASKELRPKTIMILGVDSREGEQARSDTMMLAAINPDKGTAFLVSIPRDTYAEIPGNGYTRFNHSMAYGGPSLVKETMERFLDVPVDNYVTIDFEGFRRIIDELGGIEVNVKKRMKYHDPADGTDIDLYPGLQVLDGDNALDYARYRKSDIGIADTDFERIERQHEVIRAVIDKANDLSSLFKIFSLMDILGEHVKTDLTPDEITSLVKAYRDFSPDRLATETIKGYSTRKMVGGYNLWVYVVSDEEKMRIKEIIDHVLQGKEIPPYLLNPSEDKGPAEDAGSGEPSEEEASEPVSAAPVRPSAPAPGPSAPEKPRPAAKESGGGKTPPAGAATLAGQDGSPAGNAEAAQAAEKEAAQAAGEGETSEGKEAGEAGNDWGGGTNGPPAASSGSQDVPVQRETAEEGKPSPPDENSEQLPSVENTHSSELNEKQRDESPVLR